MTPRVQPSGQLGEKKLVGVAKEKGRLKEGEPANGKPGTQRGGVNEKSNPSLTYMVLPLRHCIR